MKTFTEWLVDAHPQYLVDEGIIDSLGGNKFVRNAVAAAGVGAAALGGYGLRGMQGSKSAVDGRAVASRNIKDDWMHNADYVSYAAQQVERQLGGSQDNRIPRPQGWDDLGEDVQNRLYDIAHNGLVQQYGVKDKIELQRMFNRGF